MHRYTILFAAGIALALVASCTPKTPDTTAATPAPTATPTTDAPSTEPADNAAPPDAPEAPTEPGAPAEPAPATTASTTGADWPCFAGAKGDTIAPDTDINKDWASRPPRELWRVSLSDDGYAGPCVADGKVFIIDHRGSEDVVRAIDFATGADVWEYKYADDTKANYGFAHSTPCYDEGRIFTIGKNGQVNALDAATGNPIWSKDLKSDFGGSEPGWNYAASPIVDGDRLVLLPGGSTSVVVVDKTNGNTVWAGGGSFKAGYATPVVATINGTKQYVVFNGEALTGCTASDGKLLWQIPWPTQHAVNAALPRVDQNFVFAASGYGYGCGLAQVGSSGASLAWQTKGIIAHFNSPVYYKGYMWGTTDPGNLVALSPKDGSTVWSQSGFEKGGIVIVDDVILALDGRGGDLIMAETSIDGYKELGRIKPLGGQSWTAPIVAHGKAIIRNKSAMVCLDLM